MRCPRCGTENPTSNRFCGNCGTTLAPAPATVAAGQSGSSVPTPPASVPSPALADTQAPTSRAASPRRAPEPEPVISGPSFLGLNQPPSPGRRGNLGIDPNSTSRNLDYLLEDDAPRSGGAWKIILILIALLLAGGLGYLRFKDQGLAWLNGVTKKPSASQTSDAPDTTTAQPASGTNAATPASTTPSGSTQPAPDGTANPPTAAANKPADASKAADGAGTTAPAGGDANPAVPAASAAATKATTPPNTNAASTPPAETAAPPKHAAAQKDSADDADADDNGDSEDTDSAPAKSAAAPAAALAKPSASRPGDTVSEAQKYLYGKGAKQDCDRGLRLLKPAADRGNPKAMVEMGALYSAGLCTPRDLPTAYRWFAMALRKDPENESVNADLQKLWGEMTQPERQLAIKMSQ